MWLIKYNFWFFYVITKMSVIDNGTFWHHQPEEIHFKLCREDDCTFAVYLCLLVYGVGWSLNKCPLSIKRTVLFLTWQCEIISSSYALLYNLYSVHQRGYSYILIEAYIRHTVVVIQTGKRRRNGWRQEGGGGVPMVLKGYIFFGSNSLAVTPYFWFITCMFAKFL